MYRTIGDMKKGDAARAKNGSSIRGVIVETRVAHCLVVGRKSYWYAEGDLEMDVSRETLEDSSE